VRPLLERLSRIGWLDSGTIAHVPSFSPETRRFLESRFELIAVTDAEQRDIQINVLPLGGGRTIVKSNATRIADELARRGLTPVPVDYD
jgi:N-dimethylarginine dimethylaminohydrolase